MDTSGFATLFSFSKAHGQPVACQHWLSQKYHEVNKTITEMYLYDNEICDGGAIALAESLKAALLISFRLVRAMLFVWSARTQPHRRVICVTSVFRCWSVGVARADVFQMCYCDKMSCGHVIRACPCVSS